MTRSSDYLQEITHEHYQLVIADLRQAKQALDLYEDTKHNLGNVAPIHGDVYSGELDFLWSYYEMLEEQEIDAHFSNEEGDMIHADEIESII